MVVALFLWGLSKVRIAYAHNRIKFKGTPANTVMNVQVLKQWENLLTS
jgi:hypothetical protein